VLEDRRPVTGQVLNDLDRAPLRLADQLRKPSFANDQRAPTRRTVSR